MPTNNEAASTSEGAQVVINCGTCIAAPSEGLLFIRKYNDIAISQVGQKQCPQNTWRNVANGRKSKKIRRLPEQFVINITLISYVLDSVQGRTNILQLYGYII